jgi:hypothetical protein
MPPPERWKEWLGKWLPASEVMMNHVQVEVSEATRAYYLAIISLLPTLQHRKEFRKRAYKLRAEAKKDGRRPTWREFEPIAQDVADDLIAERIAAVQERQHQQELPAGPRILEHV